MWELFIRGIEEELPEEDDLQTIDVLGETTDLTISNY